ncbi:histone deacetylase complex subunit SAP130-like isoform X2 [Daphnia carinata]|uniref:histone deacetylase complex subunit SAP130-like isoform X2 n=1 Tax=Daphnia carinata TaxID=120202 RepID=UPI002869198F|nr:histone deacetylase complex subunit SAP130-like isoform X2 [Daphnia carinata]
MSASHTKQSSASGADNNIELQAQPMDLAHKSSPMISSSGSATSVTNRAVGEAAKPIFLVKPSGSPLPTISGSGMSLASASGPSPTLSTIVQNSPVSVAVTVPIPMAKFQAAIRPGGTVTLAPRVVPTALVTTSGTYANLPSHVPKGPAAVASIAIPRSVVASAAIIRPTPSVSPAISQVTGFTVANRAVRPTSSSAIRPSSVDVGIGAAGTLSGTWVTVTQATAVIQPPPVPTLYKATTNAAANTSVKSTTNLVLATGHKSAPQLTPAPSANSISIIGPPRASIPSPASNITLFSVRGSSNQTVVNSRVPPNPTMTVGPRPGPEVIKSTSALLQTASQRPPSMMITSTPSIQNVEKHFIKTAAGSATTSISVNANNPASSQARSSINAPVQIAARTVSQVGVIPLTSSNSLITANSGVTPVMFTGGLKNIVPLSTVTAVGKVGQQSIAVQFPQMSIPAVGTKIGNAPQPPVVTGTRPAVSNSLSVGTGGATGNSRTYLVTTQAPPSATVPVAKVLPQPVVSTAIGPSAPKTVSVTSNNVPSVSSSNETSGTTSSGASIGTYLHAGSRTSAASTENSGNQVSYPVATQPSTPSKLIGTSPRPSILRKRDYEGVPLKAQKNLTTTLTSMTSVASATPTSSSTASVSSTPAISPPSPRRLDLGLTLGGPNGDSSRSSSGGSTTLSASSSPGIPPDLDESNPTASVTTSQGSAILGKALSGIQVKQEMLENTETSGAISSLMRMSSSSSFVHPVTTEVQMSPRKKPRKQQLLGQELQEVRSSDEEVHTGVIIKEFKIEPAVKLEPKEAAAVVKRPRVSLISSYRQTWKPRNHHFTRYSDVKLKDERRPTVTDLANQKQIMQKVHGWKVFHLTAQIEEMAHSESQVHERLSLVLGMMEKLGTGKSIDRDLMRVNELIKGNLQRSKVIQDGLEDSKNQVQKIFDHKPRAEEIIQRYMYKRLAKKREKL